MIRCLRLFAAAGAKRRSSDVDRFVAQSSVSSLVTLFSALLAASLRCYEHKQVTERCLKRHIAMSKTLYPVVVVHMLSKTTPTMSKTIHVVVVDNTSFFEQRVASCRLPQMALAFGAAGCATCANRYLQQTRGAKL